ncbi:hypothetical protein [Zobellia nedashkovskayae]|uniref:hypothetical protein n=1 Tax=Zobellia nedashkovskayae TaxID=2779510 RepID=UPI00188BAFF9|nr:hypothetical protein [Zobellia nedashkovskayae]
MKKLLKVSLVFPFLSFIFFGLMSCEEDDTIEQDPNVEVKSVNGLDKNAGFGIQGDSIVLLGQNFDKVTNASLIGEGNPIELVINRALNTNFRLIFILPNLEASDVIYGNKQLVLSGAPTGDEMIDFDLRSPGRQFEPGAIFISNFDGLGYDEAGADKWGCYGSQTSSGQTADDDYGNFIEFIWDGNPDPGYGGCFSGTFPATGIEEVNPANMALALDANVNGAVGTLFSVIAQNRAGEQYTADITVGEDGWQEFSLTFADFRLASDPEARIKPSEVGQMLIAINQYTGVGPATVHVDNIRFVPLN